MSRVTEAVERARATVRTSISTDDKKAAAEKKLAAIENGQRILRRQFRAGFAVAALFVAGGVYFAAPALFRESMRELRLSDFMARPMPSGYVQLRARPGQLARHEEAEWVTGESVPYFFAPLFDPDTVTTDQGVVLVIRFSKPQTNDRLLVKGLSHSGLVTDPVPEEVRTKLEASGVSLSPLARVLEAGRTRESDLTFGGLMAGLGALLAVVLLSLWGISVAVALRGVAKAELKSRPVEARL